MLYISIIHKINCVKPCFDFNLTIEQPINVLTWNKNVWYQGYGNGGTVERQMREIKK